MSKRESLLGKLSGGLSESIGIREGEDTQPSYSTGTTRPPRANYKRSRDTGEIELREIIPDPEQPRKEFKQEELEQLSASIEKHGLIQPIRVRWSDVHDKWIIVAGERRYRAHELAGLTHIKCTFDDQTTDVTVIRSQQIIENVLREDLTGMELARSLKQLQDDNGWSAAQVAQELNISKGKVSKALALLKLPDDVQQKVEDGSISASTAYQLTKVKDPEKQQELIAKAKKGHVKTAEATRASTKKTTNGTPARTRKTTNETFRTQDGVRIAITSRKDVGEQGMINALLEVAEEIRKRSRAAA